MAEGTYEYECMRAELLGIDKPDYDSFLKKKQEAEEDDATQQVEDENNEAENLKEADLQGEKLKGVSGGMEELNNILSITQKKIDRFKVRCNSITSLLKIKVGSFAAGEGTADGQIEQSTDETGLGTQEESTAEGHSESGGGDGSDGRKVQGRKSDLSRALDGQVDQLDAMLDSADRAYCSMNEQNKKMKKFIQ